MGLMVAVIGGIVHDVLISNFFGLHLFPLRSCGLPYYLQ